MADADTAAMLLRPFRIEDLDHECVDSFGKIAGRYGQPWTAELARTWFGGKQPAWAYGGGGCACELCDTLRAFLGDKSRRTFQWPLAKDRRRHVHSRIDAAELPVTHVTRRQGRPYTLVLNKADALFTREQEARARDETDLEWLAAQWSPSA